MIHGPMSSTDGDASMWNEQKISTNNAGVSELFLASYYISRVQASAGKNTAVLKLTV